MDLVIHSKMYIATADGDREIQLCVGDITQLPPTDKVDVIFISAFPSKLSINFKSFKLH